MDQKNRAHDSCCTHHDLVRLRIYIEFNTIELNGIESKWNGMGWKEHIFKSQSIFHALIQTNKHRNRLTVAREEKTRTIISVDLCYLCLFFFEALELQLYFATRINDNKTHKINHTVAMGSYYTLTRTLVKDDGMRGEWKTHAHNRVRFL